MNYFSNITTLEAAKNEFKQLCKALHPDTSGYDSQSQFVEMHSQFKTLTNKLKFNTGFDSDKDFDGDKFYNALKQFEVLNNIQVSFVGCFIWLEDLTPGAMYQQKDLIKGIKVEGYNTARWAGKKKKWYYSSLDYKQTFKSNKTLDQIKETYGSNDFKTKGTPTLA
ncbi:hypothetical protein [Olleya marilimosa]|uniref:hypothetical protein n=1 Tax=Olleya marilimosa TaxID=272164 RepID=UPI0030ED1CAC|tara:strand:- start:103019 stop:103516 length:498 start_codon:yes stop_codon:yes gene_type:complete